LAEAIAVSAATKQCSIGSWLRGAALTVLAQESLNVRSGNAAGRHLNRSGVAVERRASAEIG
jgi:hypothetical protein